MSFHFPLKVKLSPLYLGPTGHCTLANQVALLQHSEGHTAEQSVYN